MKSIFLISLPLLFASAASAQIPDYFGNQPTWFTETVFYAEDPASSFSETRIYAVKENEIYDGYYQIKSWFSKDLFEGGHFEGPGEHLNVRQEGRAIYYYDEISEIDRLYISYDLEIGDTVKGEFTSEYPPLIVYSIDSILIGDTYRSMFFTDETPETEVNRRLIEGIGFQQAAGSMKGNYFAGENYLGYDLDYEYALNCYGEYTVPLWNGYDEADCNLTLTIEEIEQTSINISLYPNPAVNLINFAGPSDIKNIIIYNLDGATVKEISVNDKTGQINLTDFRRGIYIAEITMEDGILLRKKIVLQ